MNILTFDIEDWYHFLEYEAVENPVSWNSYENRMHESVQRILDILEENQLKACFFVIGWVARENPELIKEIYRRGNEVGMHSYTHQLIFQQSWNEFREDIATNRKIIEDITGISPVSYRAPGFSIMESTCWAFEVIAEEGIIYDSSVFPTNRNHGGFRRFPYNQPCIIETANASIKEFPVNTYDLFGEMIVFSGGGYFRLMPYKLIKYFTKRSDYVMSYFHPADLDKDKPMMKSLPWIRRFRAYYGIKDSETKLRRWLNDFEFTDLKTAASQTDWSKVPVMKL